MITKKFKSIRKEVFALIFSFSSIAVFAQQSVPAIGTFKTWGIVNGIKFTELVEGPATAQSDLQIVCVFEYTEGDIFNSPPALPAASNGLLHLDQSLKGQLTEIRKSGKFDGHYLETFYLDLSKKTISAKKLLLIGLGDRNSFSEDKMISVGGIAMREALKLGVKNFAFGSDLKDAGIDSKTALVTKNVTNGIINEYKTQTILKTQGLTKFKPLKEVFLLAGQQFFEVAGGGISDAITQVDK